LAGVGNTVRLPVFFLTFGWETWHELAVFRRELAPRFAAQKP
jgi:hypothetical protein